MKNSRTSKELKRPRGSLVRAWKRHIWDRIAVDTSSGCWIMQTPRERNGYTKTTALAIGRVWSHRLSFLAYVGNVPEGSLVLHSVECTSRACVNPTHLYLGDAKENARDRDRAGRTARGARNGRAKLTDEQVARIRELDDLPPEMISLALGVSVGHIRDIINGRRRRITA